MMTSELSDTLDEDLDPALVSELNGHSYIPAHLIIDQANRIFGYEGWSYEVIAQPSHREIPSGEWYVASVRVRAGDLVREDVGVGVVARPRNGETLPAHHDTAVKGAVSEALKRALRTFGPQFGNDLYGGGSQQPRRGAGRPVVPRLGPRWAARPREGNEGAADANGSRDADSVPDKVERLVDWAVERYGTPDGPAVTGRTLLDVIDERSWLDAIATHEGDWRGIAAAVKAGMNAARPAAEQEAP